MEKSTVNSMESNTTKSSHDKHKVYWVGTDECGIMIVTLNFRDTRGLDNVLSVPAENSEQARLEYQVLLLNQ